jgi:hypothetical protein
VKSNTSRRALVGRMRHPQGDRVRSSRTALHINRGETQNSM